jgi:hypothetical protein
LIHRPSFEIANMLTRSFASLFRRKSKPIRRNPAPPLALRFAPGVERLEDRVAPAIGTSFLASQLSESGFIPPDSNGDVSPTQILVAANGRIKVFSKTGVLGGLNVTTDAFFSTVRSAGTSDPHVRYDRLSGRWFVTMIDVASVNKVLIAVSKTSTITDQTSFNYFGFRHDSIGPQPNPDNNEFADYDTLGVDKFALYIGVSMFSGNNYAGATGFVVNKNDLINGTLTVNAFRQIGTSSGGIRTPQGVNNDDPNATEGYFIGVDGGFYGRLDVIRITNPGSATPTASSAILVSGVPTTGPAITQVSKGSTNNLSPVDDRLMAAMIHKDQVSGTVSLWTADNYGVNTSGVASTASGARNASRWYQVGNLTGTPSVLQSGLLFDSAATNPIGYWIPSVAMNGEGHMTLATSYASTNDFAGIAVSGHLRTDPSGFTAAPTQAVVSSTAYNVQSGTQRWGDYSQTVVDPTDDMTCWTFQEYCNGTNSWGVRVIQVLAPAPTLANPNGSGNQGTTVTLNLTGTDLFDPGAAYPNHLNVALSGAGISNYVITYNSPTSATVKFDIALNATVGLRNIILTNPDGQQVTVTNGFQVLSNQPPVLANIEPAPITYTENDPPTQVTNTLTVSDSDSANLAGATVWISAGFNSAQDVLAFNTAGTNITGNYNSSTGTVTFTGSDTLANYQTVLRSITYFNTSDNPTSTTRTITFKVNDGGNDSNTQQRNVQVVPVNDPPVLANIENTTLTVYSLGTPKQVTNTITANDVDNTNLASATVTVSANFTPGEDVLSFTAVGSITGSYNATTGVLTLSGSDTLANYQAVLRTVTFADTSSSPNTATRTVTFVVNDGAANSNNQQRNITVVLNLPPTVSAGGPYTTAEGNGVSLSATGSDPENDTLTWSWDINGDGAFGDATGQNPSLTWAQLQALGINDGPATFNVKVRADDGHDHTVTSSATTLTLNNTPPTIALTGNSTVNEGSSYTLNLGAITDPGQDTVSGYKINWGDGSSNSFSGIPTGAAKTHTYADGPNNYTISVDLTDEDGTFTNCGSKSITVNDVDPTIALSGNATTNEGSSYSLTLGAITDPGQDTVTAYKINWGDGVSDSFSGNPTGASKSHTYLDGPNNYTITVDLTDEDGVHTASGSKPITVNDVPPTIALSGNATVNEGSSYSLTLGAITDPGQDTVSGYKINWGDGGSDTFSGNPTGANKTHTYADGPNNYTITVDLTDEDGTHTASGSKAITVNDVPPTIALSGNNSVNEGSPYSLTLGAITDPGTDTVTSYKINWGDGASDSFTGNPVGAAKTHTYADGPNSYTISVDLTDEDGTHTNAGSKDVTVNDVAPTIALTGNSTVNEGSSYSLTLGAITDPGQDTVTAYKVNWGDGASDSFTGNPTGATKTHTYADGPNNYTITVDLTDEDGVHTASGSKPITVNDVPPTIVLTGNNTVNEGSSYTLNLGAITDPGQDTVTGYKINWGDGGSDTFSGNPTGQAKTHTYADGPNNFTITVDLTDEDGIHTASGSKPITVNDVDPTITLSGNTNVNEGSSYSLTLGAITDPGQDTVSSYKINWGDGTSDTFSGNPTGLTKTHTYADGPNSYTISADLTDEDGIHTNAGSKNVTVDNVAPTITLGGNATTNEGSLYTLNLVAVVDPGADTVSQYKINWGDGSSNTFSGVPTGQAKTHTYLDGPNSYTITVDLTDEDGSYTSAGSKPITVNDVPPAIVLTGNNTVNEGSLYSLTLGAITDPGQDTVTAYKVNWGDGASDSFTGNPTGQVKSHTYADGPNNYTITVDLTDEDGIHAASGSKPITVNDVPPTIVLTGNTTVNEGSLYSLTLGAITDPGQDTVTGYKINWGDGNSDNFTGIPTGQVKTHTYADGPNNFTITVDLTDEDGAHAASGSKPVTINNVAPTIALSGNASVNEGSPYSLTLGTITDPGQDTVSQYTINWGDGSSNTFSGVPTGQVKTHTYADGPNSYTITVDLTDEDGTYTSAGSKPVSVNDVPPTITLTGNATVNEGSAYLLTLGGITDPGQDTVSAYKINWGDGASDSFTGNPTGQLKSHTYADGPNSYTITVDLTDEDGVHTSAGSQPITVNDVPPTIDLNGALSTNEGAIYTLSLGTIHDPGQDTVTQWIVRWGDGASDTYTGGGDKTHTYADGPNTYTIHVDLADEDGTHLDAGTRLLTVNDVPPTIVLSGNANVNEGSPYSLTLGAITDPGQDTVTQYKVNWGDGASDSFTGNPTGQVKTHTYADGFNIESISVDLTDEDGTHAAAGSKSITVNDVPPTIALGGNAAVNEGSPYSLSLGAITDPGQDTVTAYTINWGDGSSDSFFVNPTGQVNTHTYADGPNNYTISVDLTDEDGTHTNTGSKAITVNDVPPTIIVTGNPTVNEGAAYSVNLGAITDPGQDTVTQWTVHWGDGLTDNYTAGGNHTHVYADGPNVYGITVDLTDEDGTHSNAGNPASVTVNNVAPTATFGYDGPRLEHRPITVRFTNPFDPSPVDTAAGFKYSFDFNNDGDFLDQDEVADGTASFASHVFTKDGTYTVHARIKDKDGGFTDYWTDVIVKNADLFVAATGGSTVGTVTAFDSLTGQARFTLTPFGPNYKYGISVANGDVTGDQIPDVVVATAGGNRTTVKVYDGFDGTELTSRQFDAFPGTTTNGVSVAVGDVNNDGYDDIVVGAGQYGPPTILVISGKDGSQLAKFAAYPSGMYGVRVAVGDVNGDGKADIIAAPITGTNAVRIFSGADFSLLRSFTPFGSFAGGFFVAAGDLNGDGKADIVVSQDQAANAKVRVFSGPTGVQLSEFTPFNNVSPQPQGARVMLADRNGDGTLEIVVGSGPNGKGHIRSFYANTLKMIDEITPFDPNFKGGIYVG